MVIYVDIDETICATPEDRDYSKAEPILEAIQEINRLYNEGNTIVYWTARGATSGIDHRKLTKKQLRKWGAKHHELRLDKPFFDRLYDDKSFVLKINREKGE